MASIDLIKASDGTGNASVPVVQNTRTAGSSTIVVDTVENINATFMASMGTPHTFVDPITAETITVISEDTCVDFSGHVDGANLEIDDIAPGQTDLGSAPDDIIIIRPTTQWGDNVASVLEVAHNDDGTLIDDLGWTSAGETWTYVSGTGTITGVFKIVGVDKTGKYQAGDKIKFTQTQVKYGIIAKVAFSTDTTITVLMSATSGTVDNSGMTNTTISANYYSRQKSPFGFPLDPTRWTITTSAANDCAKASPVSGTWYGDTGLSSTGPSITLPIGAWRVYYETHFFIDANAAADVSMSSTLSTGATTESDTSMTATMRGTLASPGRMRGTFHKEKNLTMTASTPYYLNIKANVASMASIAMQGSSIAPLIIRAVCAYL